MANIIKLKIQNSELGKNVCVWFDSGDIEVFPVTSETQSILDEFSADAIDAAELVNRFAAMAEGAVNVVSEAKQAVSVHLEKVSEHLSCDGMHVYFDGASFDKIRLDPVLEKHLIRLMTARNESPAAERDWQSYAAFAENLYANVDPRIREQFVNWLEAQKWLTFTEDGCFIGYKGCQKNAQTGIAESIYTGPGIVNGDVYNGHIPNPDGAVVEIDRSLVENNPSVGCASGMHVGTYDYARRWGDGILCRVKVNPRDVISVPFDCSAQKIRCCRYTVLDHEEYDRYGRGHDTPYSDYRDTMTYGGTDDFDDEFDEEDYEDWCDSWFEFDPYACDHYDSRCESVECFSCEHYDGERDYQFECFCENHEEEYREELHEARGEEADFGAVDAPMANDGCGCGCGWARGFERKHEHSSERDSQCDAFGDWWGEVAADAPRTESADDVKIDDEKDEPQDAKAEIEDLSKAFGLDGVGIKLNM